MYGVRVIEIVAGVAVALKPRYAAYIVAAWLAGIIVNLPGWRPVGWASVPVGARPRCPADRTRATRRFPFDTRMRED